MKVKLHISAKDLPVVRSTYALVSVNGGDDLGKTEVVNESSEPDWEKGFIFDSNEGTHVTVRIHCESGDEIGDATFDIDAVMGEKLKVLGKSMDGGGKIYAYAAEHVANGTFTFQLCGKDLANTEGFLGISRSLSDPFYELRGATGEIIITSEVIRDNLNPVWRKSEVELASLCDGDLDNEINFTIFDQDPKEKRDLIGDFDTTVKRLISAKESGEKIALTRGRRKTGAILVIVAELADYTDTKELAREATEATIKGLAAKAKAAATKAAAEERSRVATLALEEAEAAHAAAESMEEKARAAAEALAEAEMAAAEAEEVAKEAANEAATQPILGRLKFRIRGAKLKNVEGFLRKSDPFFVLQKQSKVDGKVHWSDSFTSSVVKNNLDPSWPEAEVDVSALCSGDLSENFKVVVYDHESDGKHELMGCFETSISKFLAAKDSRDAFSLMRGGCETGSVFVSEAGLSDYVDPQVAVRKAKEMADKAEEANYFVMGKKTASKMASKAAGSQRHVADKKSEAANAAVEAAEAAKEAAEQAAQFLADIGW